jgi:hypothetical protein
MYSIYLKLLLKVISFREKDLFFDFLIFLLRLNV